MAGEQNGNCRGNFPLAQLGAAFCCGILLVNTELSFSLIATAALVSTLCCVVFLLTHRHRLTSIALLLAFALCGGALALLERRPIDASRVKRLLGDQVVKPDIPVEVTGVLQSNVEISWDAVYLILDVEQIRVTGCELPATGVVSLRAPADLRQLEALKLRYGTRVRVKTRLQRTNTFRNPGVSPFTEYLDRKGYDATAYVRSLHLIERLGDDRVFLPLAWLYDWRNQLQAEIDERLSKDAAGVLDAALLGNRYNLSAAAEERFRSAGTFHVLVISGLHITFLGGLAFIVVRRLTRNRLVQVLVSAGVVWGYSIAVGAEPSIVRAALMFSVVMLARLASRRASPLNGLGAVAVALLLWKPSSLFDPSFQLTFVSVVAILVLAWPLLHALSSIGSWKLSHHFPYPPSCSGWIRWLAEALYWDERAGIRHQQSANYEYSWFKSGSAATLQNFHVQRLFRFAFASIVVSVAVQITLLPFLIVYFHRFSISSFLLNIFVGVGIAAVAFAGLAGIALAQVSTTLSAPFFGVANTINWVMVHSVDPFARLELASIRVPEYTGPLFSVYVLYYFPLGLLSLWLMKWRPLEPPKSQGGTRRRQRVLTLAACAQLCGIALLILHPYSTAGAEGKLRVDFLDVGQGDAALITLPDDTTVLVDGGGRPGPFRRGVVNESDKPRRPPRSIGETVVSEYLWFRGLDRIDYLIATHADADHVDGLNEIVRNFTVRAAFVGRIPQRDAELEKFFESLKSKSVPVRTIGAGDELRVAGVSLTVLWPRPLPETQLQSTNNDSVVLRLEYGSRSILLTGDIEAKAERALLAERNRITADVTKVAHHGSRTSSTEEFIRATGSRLAVVPVGESSVFGHPHAEVVQRWERSGARVLRTGDRGMITVVTDGRSMHFTTFVNP